MKNLPLLFTLAFMALAGWEDSALAAPSLLEAYLPDQIGYRWNYWGFAEYGHWMQLEDVSRTEDEVIYSVAGMVEDMSAGEAQGDFTISLKYMVTDSSLSVAQRAPLAMDNDYGQMELLRLPLETGSGWTQTVTDEDGEEVELVCEIEEMEGNQITVRYSRTDSPFYQLRVFEEGIGVVTFEKLYMSREGNFEIGFTLFRGNY